jgi:A/G-specific adenine glycosylase
MRPAADAPTRQASRSTPSRELRRRLLDHYDRHHRRLPWREESDPYRIWVSEVMLQQTRVETVIPYYMRWVDRFPDLDTLAGAEEDEVLTLWAGLGYYSRARNLHRAARVVRDRHGGRIPADPRELERLPGLGSYTAGAVASIAFGRRAAAVDGNVRRVLCRLFDLPDPSQADLRNRAERLVDDARPGDFNQALMELGATVCTPKRPSCPDCPVRPLCRALARGTVERRPRSRARASVPHRTFAVAVLADRQGRVLLVRRPLDGLLGGMWAFPEGELAAGRPPVAEARRVAAALGVSVARESAELPPVDHIFTHLRARYLPVLLWTRGPEGSGPRTASGQADERTHCRWIHPDDTTVALPAAQRRILGDAAQRALRSRPPRPRRAAPDAPDAHTPSPDTEPAER